MDRQTAAPPAVLVQASGGLGRLTLDRPRQINALDGPMIAALGARLTDWAGGAEVRAVLLDGAGDRGLCAGGDVRAAAQALLGGDVAGPQRFFLDEYRLNALIADYPLPVVAVMDGITMGGGIGVSGHAAIRVVTERSRLAMPEVRIGFTPDVGGTFLLSRAPGLLGLHLAATGDTVDGADAIAIGLADRYVASADLPALAEALREDGGADPGGVVDAFAADPPDPALPAERWWIDEAYSEPTAAGVVRAVEAHAATGEAAAVAARDALRSASPLSVAVTIEAVRRAGSLPDLRAVLEQEWRSVVGMIGAGDFVEGVRARLIDKDGAPRWRHRAIEDVPAEEIEAILDSVVPEPLFGAAPDPAAPGPAAV